MVAPLKLGIAGLGTVGAEVVRLIEGQSRALSARCGRPVRVVAVTARSKAKKRGLHLDGIDWAKNPLDLASQPGIDCFVELMGGSGDPALSAVEAALKCGKSVVTANKALIARHGLRLAKAAGRTGRCRPALYNAANEECVAAFVSGRLPFLGIVDTLEAVLAAAPDYAEPGTVEDVLAAEAWARAQARRMIATAAEGA